MARQCFKGPRPWEAGWARWLSIDGSPWRTMPPSPSAPGDATQEDLIADMREGLVVDILMGASQGNVLGGEFSGNVLLGYRVEKGKIVGRVKDTMVSGNIYEVLKEVVI